MSLLPTLPSMPENAPKYVKQIADALASWIQSVKLAGGYITMADADRSNITIVPEDTIHKEGVTTRVDPSANLGPAVVGIDVTEELYFTNVANIIKSRLFVTWDSMPSVLYYEVVLYSDVGLAAQSTNTSIPHCTFNDVGIGSYKIMVRAIFESLKIGRWGWVDFLTYGKQANPEPPSHVYILIYHQSSLMKIVWVAPTDLDLAGYMIRYGLTWENSELITSVGNQLDYYWKPNVSGTFRILIKSIDTSGNYSTNAAESDVFTILGPSWPVGQDSEFTSQVIDNNVLLRWLPANQGTYPVDHYVVQKGQDYDFPDLVIGNVQGTFSVIFEPFAGTYKYWVTAVDTIGVMSVPMGYYATVDQNDNYELFVTVTSTLSGDSSGILVGNNGDFTAPVNTTISYEDHFIDNPDTSLEPWASPEDQVNDGYPVFIQPGAVAGGYYEETVVYMADGDQILNFGINMDVTRRTAAGTVSVTPTIWVRALSSDSWTALGNVYTDKFPPAYRQVKYRLDFSTANGGICEVRRIVYSLSAKTKTRNGSVHALSTDTSGTMVYLTNNGTPGGTPTFIDVTNIQLTPKGTSGMVAIYDIGIEASPTHFHIYLFDLTGARISGIVNWTAKGV